MAPATWIEKYIEFFPLPAGGQKIFGFSEFLAGLALMVLAWTIADVRYRFRVQSAPLALQRITFWVVGAVGTLTLLTDLWRAEQWRVVKGNLLSAGSWQAFLGAIFLVTFLTWAWFAFIDPPRFGRLNMKRYAQSFYNIILKGSSADLVIIADELRHSVRAIIFHASSPERTRNFNFALGNNEWRERPTKVETFANDLLLLIGDRRFCRAMVDSSPGTALVVFQEMTKASKYCVGAKTFARNFLTEALENKDSFIFHEEAGFKTGFLGYRKPLSQAMFADFAMVESLGTLLEPDHTSVAKWDADQWKAYCRVTLISFRAYVEGSYQGHSVPLYRAVDRIGSAMHDLYMLNGVEFQSGDVHSRLYHIVDFIRSCIEILNTRGEPEDLVLRLRGQSTYVGESFYDYLAKVIYDLIRYAAYVTTPSWPSWHIQYGSVWSRLFNYGNTNGPAGEIIAFKVRRRLFDEVSKMERFPNFEGAKILSYCLNVMGFEVKLDKNLRDTAALHKALLRWTKAHYSRLRDQNVRVADACLIDGMTFDSATNRIVKTYPVEGLRRIEHTVYLSVDPL